MKTSLAPWLVFFRLPNLPTAPGDAIAGVPTLTSATTSGSSWRNAM